MGDAFADKTRQDETRRGKCSQASKELKRATQTESFPILGLTYFVFSDSPLHHLNYHYNLLQHCTVNTHMMWLIL
jgi:hypothetical protein